MSEGVTIVVNAETAEAAEKLKKLFEGFNEKLNEFTKVGEFFEGLAGKIVAAFALDAIIEHFNQAIEAAEKLGHVAEQTGLSINALGALKSLGGKNNLPFDEMSAGLALFNDKLFNAVRMGGEAARPFRDLGIAVADTNGQVRETEGPFKQLMQWFHDTGEGAQKTSTAIEFFGRNGRQWIPFMNQGPEALEKLQASGGGITPEMVQNASAFNNAMGELKGTFNAIFTEATKEILPTLQDLVQWLNTTAKESGDTATASGALVIGFKIFATAVAKCRAELVTAQEFLSNVFVLAVESCKDNVQLISDVFDTWWTAIKNIKSDLIDLVKSVAVAGRALADLASGDFKKSWEESQQFIARISSDLTNIGGNLLSATEDSASKVSKTWKREWDNLKEAAISTFTTWRQQENQFISAFQSIWSDKHVTAPGGEKPTEAPKSGGGEGSTLSKEAERLSDELTKLYRQTTNTREELLKAEQEKIEETLLKEFTNESDLLEAEYQLEVIYDAKRRALKEKQADDDANQNLQKLQNKRELIQSDPDLTELQRREQLIDALKQEKDLLTQMLQVQQQRASDPSQNEDDRLRAKNESLRLQRELNGVDQQSRGLQQSPFRKTLLNIQNQWDSWSTQLADHFQSVFENAISSISNGITGLIMGTKSWGQALQEIGTSILTSVVQAIVEMGVRWVATRIMMAAAGESVAAGMVAAMTPIAAGLSALWAVPATLATIASYSAAADAAPAAVFAAEGEVLAGSVLGMEKGGIIPGGEQFIRVNEGDKTEAVLNHNAFRKFGPDFINKLNQGVLDLYHLPSDVISGIAQPAGEQSAGGGAGAAGSTRAGGQGGVNVNGHSLNVAIINSDPHSAVREFFKSKPGQKMLVDAARRSRLDIGIKT